MNKRDTKKKVTPGTLIAIAVVLAAASPELFGTILGFAIIIALFASPFLILYFVSKKKGSAAAQKPASRQEPAFDDCPKPFCFHKDKDEHHVRKGKELDPWDRPDIDIRKSQRRH